MKKSLVGLVILLALSMTTKSQEKISYEVSFVAPQAHYAEVEMNLSGINKDFIDVKMPVWAPGSYLVREFAKNVEGFKASSGSQALKAEKIDKNTWRIHHAKAAAVKINYRVYAFEISVRTSYIDESHAFLSSTGIFMYPDGMLKSPSTVKIVPFKTWSKVSTGLSPVEGQPFTYHAPDFDILFDSPIEVGNQDVFEFMASGVRHEVAMVGGGNYDAARLKVDMAKIVEAGTAIYGENPNKHYTFIVHHFSSGGGGLEHLNSTVLGASRMQYSNERGYLGFLNLVAHEYYHLWNVKRLRPVALGPFDYNKENYSTNLWISEGFTAYYENKLMLRAGFNKPETFVQDLANAVASVDNTPGARVQSASEASFDAWIKFYRPNENSNNSTISYYSKGEVIGLLMDLKIADASKGTKSLDDVMKAMYEEGKRLGRGYTDAEFKAMVEKISGANFDEFWAKYVNGTAPAEYQKYFALAGINVKNSNEGLQEPYLGAATRVVDGRVIVTSVARGSAAWDAGLNVNDVVATVDNTVAEAVLARMPAVTGKKVGDVINIAVVRDGIEKVIPVTLKANPNIRLVAEINPKASKQQLAVRKKWFGI